MTTPSRISRLASAVLEFAPHRTAAKRTAPTPSVTSRTTTAPTESRKAPQSSHSEAPALPFIPFHCRKAQARDLFEQRQARNNRKRIHRQPPLALAMVCLLASTTALFATSREGEAEITSWVPAVKQTVESAKTAVLHSAASKDELSLNQADPR